MSSTKNVKILTFHLFFFKKTIQHILNAEEIKERGKATVKTGQQGQHMMSVGTWGSKPNSPALSPKGLLPGNLGCWAHPS